ncbi:hypothetical protein [Duganella levis]|uniref:Uncharacterized protein n=1 Tax=Duganella levis TaxID=2692169 RepID=A0ABW9W3H0_9BURK|nr:hypothetical protein [Duganella levis]MYN28474.1 hypothetical protein [Duganella levis]
MKIEISDVEELSSPIGHLLPVQSLKQLGSYIVSTIVGFFIFQSILMALKLPPAPPIVLIAAFSGSSVILNLTLPARFFIEMESIGDDLILLNDIKNRIVKYGYQQSNGGSVTVYYFKSRLPSIISWKENDIALEKAKNKITLRGPVLMMRILRGNIIKKPLAKQIFI